MLLDMSLIQPIRESAAEIKAKQRRQEKDKARKVLPRQDSGEPRDQRESRQPKGQALNAYI